MFANVILLSSVFLISVPSYFVFGQKNVFHSIIDQCNRTFLIHKDTIYIDDVDKLENIMKVDRNGRCFIHCFLQKLDLVDPKGSIRKQGLIDNIGKILQKLPNEPKNLSLQQQKVMHNFIETCENSDLVKQEPDPCEKLFKFFVCLKNAK